MEEFVIYKYNDSGKKYYIETIYQKSLSTDSDITDAMRFDDIETALKVKDYINRREDTAYKVMQIKTECIDIEE